jgi:DNA-binding response OmpR family regulator
MGKYILVVDDDTLPRRSLSFQLEQVGYSTGTAASAEYAVAHVEVERTDLILLDVGLLGMDGLKALRHFQNDMAIPVILVTARRRELNKILGLELGADSFITNHCQRYGRGPQRTVGS